MLDGGFDPERITEYAPTRPSYQCGKEMDITREDYVQMKVRIEEPNPRCDSDESYYFPAFGSKKGWSNWASTEL